MYSSKSLSKHRKHTRLACFSWYSTLGANISGSFAWFMLKLTDLTLPSLNYHTACGKIQYCSLQSKYTRSDANLSSVLSCLLNPNWTHFRFVEWEGNQLIHSEWVVQLFSQVLQFIHYSLLTFIISFNCASFFSTILRAEEATTIVQQQHSLFIHSFIHYTHSFIYALFIVLNW